ncbi:glycosyltransferase [Luminiphilus sp.]|nr:glycosyltransferase [Luminiphilus sp.]
MLSEPSSSAELHGPGVILYDFLAQAGGAENLTQSLLNEYPNADLCVGFLEKTSLASINTESRSIIDLEARLAVPFISTSLLIWRFKKLAPRLKKYQWLIFSGSFALFSSSAAHKERNILYCHQLPRFCFDLRHHYVQKLPWVLRPFFSILVSYVRHEYAKALKNMRLVIANSEHTQRELAHHFNQPSQVIYPPVDVARFRWMGTKDYFLSSARLEDFKRVDQVITAFKEMPDKRLIVTSGGTEKEALMALADGADNITFTGWVSEEELVELTGFCSGVIYLPITEPFGITPIEAMAAGKPVIGVAAGGMLETIQHNKTGILIEGTLTTEKICMAIHQVIDMDQSALKTACQAQASLFKEQVFLEQMEKALRQDES